MKNILFALILLIFASCSQNQTNTTKKVKNDCYYPVPDKVTMLTEDNMPNVEIFTLEKISLPSKYLNSDYYVYQDSLVVILNNSNPTPYIITIYNLNTKQEIAGYFKKGNGPNELISVSAKFQNNNLLLKDGNLHALTQLNMDSVILNGENYIPSTTFYEAYNISDFVFLGNDTIVSANGMFIKGFDVDDVSEFELYDAKTGKALNDYLPNDKNFPPNAVGRNVTLSNSNFIVFWSRFPIISIYDKNFNIIKQYRDSKFKDDKLSIVDDYNSILCKESMSFYFKFGFQTNNYIITHNFRSNINYKDLKSPEDLDVVANKFYEIWIFDIDMNFKRRLKPEDSMLKRIGNISYCENSNTFYLTCDDEDGECSLFKCILK